MKIAVTSMGESMESPIDQRFGRARFFVLYDLESGEWTVHDNKQNFQAAQGAGIQAAQHVVNMGAEAVITGHCGPKAFVTLNAGDITIYEEASGSVQDAINAYQAGSLKKSDQSQVEAGYGSV